MNDKKNQSVENEPCCAPFDPAPWDDRELVWENKRFVKDRVRSFFHIPLNFPAIMKRNMARIEAAGAAANEFILLSTEDSLWGSDIFIHVSKDVPGAEMANISGVFFSKVYEGPYSKIGQWVRDLKSRLQSRGKTVGQLFFFYTTCPKCAKFYGKNYVALLARQK